ncbi:MAG TPA: hypothetical protein VMG12_36560 [Polyangiaceae bacterium]|nr:hypothetical protein [Polyangiaceae bacterium]
MPSESALPLGVRLQILTGVVPLAGYLCLHLLTQATALSGPSAHARWGSLPTSWHWVALEIALVHLPLVLHIALGVLRVMRPSPAPDAGGVSAFARQLTRASGLVLLLFLLVHVGEWRLRAWTGELAPSDVYPELCAQLSSTRWGGVPFAAFGYLLGVAAAAHHGAQGLYQAAFGLGLIGTARAGAWRRCCIALGLAWFGLGALIVIDLATGSVLIHLPGS